MNTFRIKRRTTGAAGAPTTLLSAELAYNEVDNILYYGKGVSTGVTAASVVAIGGDGYNVTLSGVQTIAGDKNFTGVTNVPTVVAADNSTKAANTSWVRTYAQPLSAALTSIVALATFGFTVQTSAGVYAIRSIATNSARITVSNPDGVLGNPTFDLASGIVTPGSYTKVTVDTYGRVTLGGALASGDITTALGFTPENTANKGVANGYADLDATGKVPSSQLPASVSGGMNYQGTWNAATNTPIFVNGVGTKGYFYKVAVAGNTTIDGNTNWSVGDVIAYNGTAWDKLEGGQPDVVSVAGRIGAVTLTNTDIGGLGTLATQNANLVNITGGTVAAATISGDISGKASNVTGTVAVGNGGTGATTLTGYVKGTGTTAMTSSATIPNTDITGLGSMSTQNASAVSITGGSIDNIVFDGGTF